MYRRIIGLTILTLMALLLGSCIEKTDKYDDPVVTKLDATLAMVDTLQDSLTTLDEYFIEVMDIIQVASVHYDSVDSVNRALQEENQELKAQLAQAREVIPTMRKQYEDIFATQQKVIDRKDKKISALKGENRKLQNDNDNWRGDNAALQTEFDWLKQWADKWRHDSQRGFVKVMFGSGKAPIPNVPMPQLE